MTKRRQKHAVLFWSKRKYVGVVMTITKLVIFCESLRYGRHCANCSAVQYAVCTNLWSKYYRYPYVTVEETEAERGECNQFISART